MLETFLCLQGEAGNKPTLQFHGTPKTKIFKPAAELLHLPRVEILESILQLCFTRGPTKPLQMASK